MPYELTNAPPPTTTTRPRPRREAGVELHLVGPGEVRVDRGAPLPERPPAGGALVEIDRVTLCGSDLALFGGHYGAPSAYPIRFGHEWAGRVLAVADGVDLVPGDEVTGDCSRWCGACDRCRRDPNLCRQIEKFGISVDGFSIRRRWVDARYLYVNSRGLPASLLAVTELFAVAWRGLSRGVARAFDAQALECDRLMVIGGGPLGIAVALLARWRFGFARVTVWEAQAARRRALEPLFPELEIDEPRTTEAAAPSYRQLERRGGARLVCDGTNAASGFDAALAAAAIGGVVVAFGLGPRGSVDTRLMVTKSLEILGSIGGTGGFDHAMAALADPRVEATRLLSRRYPALAAARAFRQTVADPAILKTQLDFGKDGV